MKQGAQEKETQGQTARDFLLDALVYVTGHFGHTRSGAALSAGLPVPASGFTPQLFCRAAARAGLKAKVVKKSLAAIPPQVTPAVLCLKGGRAVVLLGREGRLLRLRDLEKNDTADVAIDAVEKDYTGYAIYLRPDSEAEGESAHWFWSELRECAGIYARVLLATALINVFALTGPLFMMNFYDRVLPSNAVETGWVLGIGALSIFVFDFIIRSLRGYFIDFAGRRAEVVTGQRLYDQALDIRLAARPPSAGGFANTLREFDSLREFFNSATLTGFVDFPFSLLFIGVIWAVGGGTLAALLVVFYLVVMLTAFVTQLPVRRQVLRAMKGAETRHGLLVETISSLETIKGVGGEGRLRAKYAQAIAQAAAAGQGSRLWSGLSVNVSMMVQQASGVILVLAGMYLVADGNLTPGALIGCVILSGRALAPVGAVAGLVNKFHQARASYRALDRIMKLPVDRPRDKRFLHRPVLEGRIAVKSASFAYPRASGEAIRNVSLAIRAGEKVAIAGRIGSGKSTLLKLLAGFYECASGSVLIDDTDIRQIDPADLRRNVAYVGQEAMLFTGTLRENIVLGRMHATDEEVLRVAKIAGVDDFARLHPMGYDMPVGERGEGLSGGQRQAVALARALLLDAPVLLMDEPTSAMDSYNEAKLISALMPVLQGRTVIIVTHRGSMLKLADRIILMDQGAIVTDGPRDAVLEALNAGKIQVPT